MAKEIKIKELPPKIKEIIEEDKKEKKKNSSDNNDLEKEVRENPFSFNDKSSANISPVLRAREIRDPNIPEQTPLSRREPSTSAFSYNPSLRSTGSENKYNPSIESNLPENVVIRQNQPQSRPMLPESSTFERNQNRLRENNPLDNPNTLREYQDRNIQERKRRRDFF